MKNTLKVGAFLLAALCSIKISAQTLQCPALEGARSEIWQLSSQDSAKWEQNHDFQLLYFWGWPPRSVFGADIKVTAFVFPGKHMKCRYQFPLKEGAYIVKSKEKIKAVVDMANWPVATEHVNPYKKNVFTGNKKFYQCETTGADLGKCAVTTEE